MAFDNDYLDYLKSLADDSISSASRSIYSAMNTGIQGYQNAGKESDRAYDDLADTSEANRFRSRRVQATNQDKMGMLSSGLGRQERLYLDTKYGNQLMDILAQKQSARDKVEQSISELRANAEQSIADVKNSFANQISSILAQMAAYEQPSYSQPSAPASTPKQTPVETPKIPTTPTKSSYVAPNFAPLNNNVGTQLWQFKNQTPSTPSTPTKTSMSAKEKLLMSGSDIKGGR